MARRAFALIHVVILLTIFCMPACAFAADSVAYNPLAVYTGQIHGLDFALPGLPLLLHDADYEGLWVNSHQLMGNCGKDGAEFQFRWGDISQWIAGYQTSYPDASYEQIAPQALYGYAVFIMRNYDASVSNATVSQHGQMIKLTFDYAYPDSPDDAYSAVCYLNGTKAVCLLAESCEHTLEALKLLQPAAYASEGSQQPETVAFFGLPMTFPASPVVTSSENSTMALCFTEDFSPICVQYQPVGLVLEATEQEVAETMASVARTMISGYGASIIANSQLSGSADTLWRIDFSTQVDMGFGEPFANTWLCSALVGEAGIWYISAGDTAQGRQFMASIGTQAVAEPVVSSGLMIEAAALMAQPRAQDASPATVYQFAGDLYALLKEQTYGCTLGTDYLEVSGAIFMDGRWVRVVSTGYADIFALLYLAASEEDAAINEVRVLGIEGCDLQTYRTFAACCVLAAEGPEAKKELAAFAEDLQATLPSQRYKSHCAPVASEFTTLSYQRLTMVAHEPAQSHPLFSLEEDEELPLYYLEPRMTVSQFYTEWETVNQTLYQGLYPLQKLSTQPMDEETFIHYSAASENTFVALTALGSGDDALIISVDVYNTANSAPPEALLCGLMSFAAATQIPQDQFAALLLALTEYPLWADLCSMRPLAVWNDAMLVVFTGQMSDGTATASAILSGIPQ